MVFQYVCILFSGVLFCCCCIRNSVSNRVRVNKNEIDHGIAFSKLQEVIEMMVSTIFVKLSDKNV